VIDATELMTEPRIAIAHEWLVRYAGSERVVEEIRRAFPASALRASLVARDRVPPALSDADATFLQRIPGAADHHEWLLPLMPLAWRRLDPLDGVDAVVSSSHACVRSIRVAPGIPHLCYCHTPMRYAWDFPAEQRRFPALVRPIARAVMPGVRTWDRRTAQRVTAFVANSSAVAGRIQRFYGRSAEVIHPPVQTDFFTPGKTDREGFLYVGRLVGYKRADLAVECFRDLPHRLTVIGEGHLDAELRASAPSNVTFIPRVSKAQLREHYRSAQALVYPADEDFGITMAEAQACGTPVIGLKAGGALDIVRDGETGFLADAPSREQIRTLIRRVASAQLDQDHIAASAQRFSTEVFRSSIRAAVEQLLATSSARGRSAG